MNLQKLPEFGRNMTSLCFLDVRSTQINKIPLSIINLINLKYLDLSDCYMLRFCPLPQFPPNLIICGSYCPLLKLTKALRVLNKGPIHVFYDYYCYLYLWKSGVPMWFKEREHRRSKSNSGDFVTRTANLPHHENAYYNGACWEIAICLLFGGRSDDEEAWRGFSINWKFQDYYHLNLNPNPNDYEIDDHIWVDRGGRLGYRVYVGVYPIDKKHCRPHPTCVGSQVDLTLCFPTPNITSCNKTSYQNFEVMQCWWSLHCKM